MIPQSFIQQLILNSNIEDVIGSYVNIKKMGRMSKGLCPFHSEKTPSFVVYPESQSFYCFGCGVGGDAIVFIKLIENLDYVESIKFLASRAGMTVPEGDFDDAQSKLRQTILDINRDTARFFHNCLKNDAGRIGYKYFRERGLTDEIITKYGLGFAPDSWHSLFEHLRKIGYTREDMVAAAVCAKGKGNNIYDQFRNRVMFPIIDLRGNVIAFGGRVLDDSKPKYLNSSDTLAFKKSKNLFSLNFAKNEIKDKVILAEGYMDVIAINAAGFKYVVATLGTALTEEQARLIAKYAKQVIIAYDSDEAGQKATHRAINLLSAVNVQTRVLIMEGAKDPDEYIKKYGAKRFEMLINGATDVIEHELDMLKKTLDLKTSEGKIEYLKRAVHIIADIRNPLEREVYAATIARDTGSMLDTILSSANAIIKKKFQKNQKDEWRDIVQNKPIIHDKINPQKKLHLREANAEEGIIAFLFTHPDVVDYSTSKISPQDFVTDFNRKVYSSIIDIAKTGEVCLASLSNIFTTEEIGSISGILARNNDIINSKNSFDEYVKILLNYKDTLSKDDIINVDSDVIEKYRQKLKNKK